MFGDIYLALSCFQRVEAGRSPHFDFSRVRSKELCFGAKLALDTLA